MSVWSRLKEKWNIKSNWQMAVIFFVFAITGMSAVQVRKIIFPLLGIGAETDIWIKVVVWIFVLFPFYYVFLLSYGFLFGQFDFFWGMTKKTFGRFGRLFGK